MAEQDLFEHAKFVWDEEIAYAETLRTRRNLYGTGLALVAGLGIFRLDPLISEDQVFVVSAPGWRAFILILIFFSLFVFLMGGFRLYTSGSPTAQETAILEKLKLVPTSRSKRGRPLPKRRRVPRASSLLVLRSDVEEALLVADTATAKVIRAKNLQIATRLLRESNRRVSNRIRSAGLYIGLGYTSLVIAVAVYLANTHV